MGASISVVTVIFFIGFLAAGTIMYSSFDYYKNLVRNGQLDQETIKKTKMQTDITIVNITFLNNSNNSRLNVTVKNTGKTILNASALDVFIDGKFYNYNLSTAKTWAPENRTNITIYPLNYTNTRGDRLKIVAGNGISDYALIP